MIQPYRPMPPSFPAAPAAPAALAAPAAPAAPVAPWPTPIMQPRVQPPVQAQKIYTDPLSKLGYTLVGTPIGAVIGAGIGFALAGPLGAARGAVMGASVPGLFLAATEWFKTPKSPGGTVDRSVAYVLVGFPLVSVIGYNLGSAIAGTLAGAAWGAVIGAALPIGLILVYATIRRWLEPPVVYDPNDPRWQPTPNQPKPDVPTVPAATYYR